MNALQEQFEKEGYVVVRNLLTPAGVSEYKTKLQNLSGLTDKDFNEKQARKCGWTLADGVTKRRDWWPLIFNEKLIATVREILGPDTCYTQHSDLHVHHGTVGWHRDSVDRVFGHGPDWEESQEPYRIARIAIYLQSYAESGSAIGFVPKSHLQESPWTTQEMAMHRRISKLLKRPDLLFPSLTVRPVWITTEPGDCAIFNQRILHSGSHIYGPKYAIFLSYGKNNHHSRNHRNYYLHGRQDLKYEEFHSDLVKRLADANLLLDMKTPVREPVGV